MKDAEGIPMKSSPVDDQQLTAIIREMPGAFTIIEYADAFKRHFPTKWRELVKTYGLYGSGTRYSALTYLSNRLSSYSRRREPGLLEPTPVGWKPQESRFLRRTTAEERERFGSHWIVIFRRVG